MNDNASDVTPARPIGPWGWFAIAVLAGFLIAALVYAVHAWSALGGVTLSPLGWTFLVLGAVVTTGIGAGLMALLFWSSRKGRDF
jgi:hypothetical protein